MTKLFFIFLWHNEEVNHILAGEDMIMTGEGVYLHVKYELIGGLTKTEKHVFVPWWRIDYILFDGDEYDALIKRLEDAGYKGDRETA